MTLISKFFFFGIYSSFFYLLSDVFSNHSITAVIDNQIFYFKFTNGCVSHGAVLSPTLFLLSINNLFSVTSLFIQSYVDYLTLHYSFHFERYPSQQQLVGSKRTTLKQLTSDIFFPIWSIENSNFIFQQDVFFNAAITSWKIHNSAFHMSIIFLVLRFLEILIEMFTLLLFLIKLWRG